jgi:GNAT superfamily N-acetyltransferase
MLNIRPASIADIPLIRELTFKVWPQTYASILSQQQIDYMLDLMYSEVSLKKQMEEGSYFIIAEEGKEPVGFASYGEINPSIFKLHKIYILASQQGKGTGSFVIGHIINQTRKLGANTLQLQVNRNNQAKNFYERLGFAVVEEADFDIGGGYFMNDYIMEKRL